MAHSLSNRTISANSPASRLAFALGGGGARGAMQVGALRALLEAGIRSDLLVGTSIGAVNAAMIAIHGFSLTGLERLEDAWLDAKNTDLLPGDYIHIAMRTMLNRMGKETYHRQMRAFYIRHGITPDLQFRDLSGPALYCVATDLNHYTPVIFGRDPDQRVLDGVAASSAIPPWIAPLRLDKAWLMDGGALSNLPIEPSIRMGAAEIIALDLFEPRPPDVDARGFSPFLDKLLTSVEHRQIEMELALAAAQGVPVHHWRFRYQRMIPVWDFRDTEALFESGYVQAQAFLQKMRKMQAQNRQASPSGWRARLRAWWQGLE